MASPKLFRRFSDESSREQAEKLFDSVRDLMRTNRSPLFVLGEEKGGGRENGVASLSTTPPS
jgi:hypothetical protein